MRIPTGGLPSATVESEAAELAVIVSYESRLVRVLGNIVRGILEVGNRQWQMCRGCYNIHHETTSVVTSRIIGEGAWHHCS